LVVATVDRTHFNLVTFDPAAGTAAFVGNVAYYGLGSSLGTRPAAGAWCTHQRVNENLAGAWPAQHEADDYVTHDLNAEQLEQRQKARIEQLKKEAAQQKKEAVSAKPPTASGAGGAVASASISADELQAVDEEPGGQRVRKGRSH
jgi:hypothetical protein